MPTEQVGVQFSQLFNAVPSWTLHDSLQASCLFRRQSRELNLSRKHASVTSGIHGNADVGGSGRRETAVDESRKKTADRAAKYQTEYVVGEICLSKPLVLRRLPRAFFFAFRLSWRFLSRLIVFGLRCSTVLTVCHISGWARHLFPSIYSNIILSIYEVYIVSLFLSFLCLSLHCILW